MFNKLLNGTIIGLSYWTVLLLGFKAGKSAMKDDMERDQLARENEELKKQLNSKKKES